MMVCHKWRVLIPHYFCYRGLIHYEHRHTGPADISEAEAVFTRKNQCPYSTIYCLFLIIYFLSNVTHLLCILMI